MTASNENQEPLRAEDATRLLEALVNLYDAGETDPSAPNGSPIEAAKAILLRCDEGLPAALPELIAKLLPHAGQGRSDPATLTAFGRLCGESCASAMADKARSLLDRSAIARIEIDVMMSLEEPEALATAHAILRTPVRQAYDIAEPHGCLVENPAFYRAVLAMARSRLDGISDGTIGYRSDQAFTAGEGRLLGRIMSFGLKQRISEILGELGPIWTRASVAPTAAKTMPSQSVTIAIGKAVESDPTPVVVATMSKVLSNLRHQGVRKKLTRMLGSAKRRLAERPDLFLLLPPGEPIPKSLVVPIRRSVENLFRHSSEMPFSEWQTRFMSHDHVRSLSEQLIWSVRSSDGECFSARPHTRDGGLTWRLAGASAAAHSDQMVKLWHPVAASEEDRNAWRDHVVATKLVQPFMQAFRQHYRVPDADLDESQTPAFTNHWVSFKPLLGAAVSEGWQIQGYQCLTFAHETLLVHLYTSENLFPGIDSVGMTGYLEAFRRRAGEQRPQPIRLREVDPVLMSEILRSVDLMTSVGAWACDPLGLEKALSGDWRYGTSAAMPGEKPLSMRAGARTADMRRQALRRLYGSDEARDEPRVVGRFLMVGEHAIHIGTGRVTLHGDPVELDLSAKTKATIWMPYADEVLGRIIRSVGILQGRGV